MTVELRPTRKSDVGTMNEAAADGKHPSSLSRKNEERAGAGSRGDETTRTGGRGHGRAWKRLARAASVQSLLRNCRQEVQRIVNANAHTVAVAAGADHTAGETCVAVPPNKKTKFQSSKVKVENETGQPLLPVAPLNFHPAQSRGAATGELLFKHRDQCNELAEVVKAFGPVMRAEDHALLDAVIVRGQSVKMVARLLDAPEYRVRRRLAGLLRIVTSFEFEYVLRRRSEWTPRRRCVGDACFLRGLSIRAAASVLDLTLDQVRREGAKAA